MKDEDKTKEQLIAELAELRGRLAETEKRENHLREAEDEMHNALTLNQAILDSSPAGIVIFRADGQGVLANNAAARITGGSREQLAAANYHSIASWKACGLYEAACKVVETGEVVKLETYMITTYGREIWIDATFSAFMLGEERYLAVLFNDISGRKQAEQEAGRARKDLESFFSLIPVMACIASTDGYFKRLNTAWEQVLGYSVEELLSRPFIEFVHPDDIESTLKEFEKQIAGHSMINFVNRYRHKDGSYRFLEWRSTEAHDKTLLYATARDITDRKLMDDSRIFLAQSGGYSERLDFFHSLAQYLGQKLSVDFVCIDRLEEGNLAATTLAVYFDGRFEDSMTYTLKDTPCGEVVEKAICCVPSGVCNLFPNDRVLQDMKAESYAGTVLWGHKGKPIGLIALIWRRPLTNTDLVKSLLQMVGVRAAGELERKLAEDELRRSEERYRTLAETAHDMIFIINREGYIEYVNRFAAQQFGLKPEELIGRRRADMFGNPESERQQFHLNMIFESGEPFYREDESPTRFPEADKWLGTWLVPLRDGGGSVRAVLGISRDITERRAMEDQLRESKLMLRSVLDTIPVRVFWKDLNSVYLGCNRPFALDAGLSDPGELLGKDDYAMGWREQADLYRADDQQVMDSGIPKLNFEEPQTTPDGRQITLRTSKIPLLDSSGRIYGVLGTYEDITESKQTEAQLRKLSTAIEQSPASVVITDADGNIEYVNPKFTKLTGYSLEEAIGQNPRILKSDVLPQEEYERLWQTITAGDVWRGEFCNKKKNGDLYWESAVISPVKDANGAITHFLAVKEDITELKRSGEEKKGLEAQLRQAQKLETIGTLAGGIAHDFNNILQPVNSCTDMLRSQLPANSSLLKYVDLMSRSVDRGSGLVRQLLTFSRQREHERRSVRLQPVVEETLNLLRAVMPATVEIQEEIDPACDPILADPVQIQQVVMNLCTNACDAMDRNGVLMVRLDVVVVDGAAARNSLRLRPGRYARITVRDTGHGMDNETRKRIFDPFFTTKEVGKGTGLGLSVVHGIVLEHDGEIVVESEPGKGTTFSVYFPCTAIAVEEEPENRPAATCEGRGAVLFVDDNEDIVFIAEEMMNHLGYTVTATTRYAEALDLFRKKLGGYDLVISDYSMPGMNGIQFAWEILNMRPDIPILLITGNNEAIPPEKLKEVPIRGVLSKPFKMDEISETMRKVLEE